jgi:DUF4097 and DUF4098 domain-containing protein YvlB
MLTSKERGSAMSKFPRGRHVVGCVTLALAALASAGCHVDFSEFRSEARDEWTREYALTADGEIEIRNTNGSIEVEPSTDGKVHVVAERIAKAGSDEAAKELLKKTEVGEEVAADRIRIETRRSAAFMSGGAMTVNYRLRVPEAVRTSLQNTNGRITLSSLSGRVRAQTTNGAVRGEGLRGRVEASTTNGGIELELSALHQEGITLETTNGGIRLRLPESAQADISARTVNGGISTGSLPVEAVGETSRRRLEGRMNGGGSRVRLETTNGGIRLDGGRGPAGATD